MVLLKRSLYSAIRAFSLLELLAVISIIALLNALLLPSLSSVHTSALKVQTKGQFNEYIFAYENFKKTYGFFPSMGHSLNRFNLAGENAVFIETLSALGHESSQLTIDYAKSANPSLLSFVSFVESHFAYVAGQRIIVDAFENPNIVFVIDRDLDGRIPLSDFGEMPDDAFSAGVDFLYAGVAVYSDNRTDNPDWRWIYSWK